MPIPQDLAINAMNTPTHTGVVISDNLAAIELSNKRLAEIINVPVAVLNGILNGKHPLSAVVALRIEAATGMDVETLVNIRKNRFTEAAKACNAAPVETFSAELKRQINEHFDKNAEGSDCGDE